MNTAANDAAAAGRTEVADAVSEEIRACVRLRNCIAAQQRALVAHDVAQVEETTQALNDALAGLEAAARARSSALRGVTTEAGREEGRDADELRRLREICDDIRRDATLNQEIITDTLAYTRTVLDALTPLDGTYSRTRRRAVSQAA
jgi:hypothetical protein